MKYDPIVYQERILNGRHLAQTLVEGYYCLLGSGVDSLVVALTLALTSVDITHFFKIRLPATRGGVEEHERVLEVVWHHWVAVPPFPKRICKETELPLHIKIHIEEEFQKWEENIFEVTVKPKMF